MLLNQSKFAQAVNLSRNAINKAVKSGVVVLNDDKKIDTDDKVNKTYIYSDAKKKSAFFRYKKKNEVPVKASVPKTTKKKTVAKKKEVVPAAIIEETVEKENIPGDDDHVTESISLGDIAEQKQVVSLKIEQEKFIKFALANQQSVNKLANRDGLQFVTERFINHFVTAIKRVSSTALTDISKEILANGKIENSHFSHFEDACLEMVHDSKMKMIKDMKQLNI